MRCEDTFIMICIKIRLEIQLVLKLQIRENAQKYQSMTRLLLLLLTQGVIALRVMRKRTPELRQQKGAHPVYPDFTYFPPPSPFGGPGEDEALEGDGSAVEAADGPVHVPARPRVDLHQAAARGPSRREGGEYEVYGPEGGGAGCGGGAKAAARSDAR